MQVDEGMYARQRYVFEGIICHVWIGAMCTALIVRTYRVTLEVEHVLDEGSAAKISKRLTSP